MTEFAFSLEWEKLGNEGADAALVTERARVFGGWLVRVGTNPAAMALTFVADGEGRWDGEDFGVEDYEEDEDDEEDFEDEEEEEGDEDEEYEDEDEDEEEEEEDDAEGDDADATGGARA
ncbi:DNA primase [Stenotrophomonas sp.]|uniref:DNA primase n=1 Tax=Stenotrophomonas sp. TaxID=69392 RepID=UPI0028AAAF8E|nr:DNA primase [Stenotrophomonas sp.]